MSSLLPDSDDKHVAVCEVKDYWEGQQQSSNKHSLTVITQLSTASPLK